jgi:2'-5' RNA ligase
MMSKYNLAVCPPDAIVAAVREMKQVLAKHAGWFHSKNSEAHITINVFEADEEELAAWKNYTAGFCPALVPFKVCLVRTGYFDTGAFYLAPDESSAKRLREMLLEFHKNTPLEPTAKSEEPHVTIARQLKPGPLAIANGLWEREVFNLEFVCDHVALRKFDPEKKQYEVTDRFYFGGRR